MPLTIQAHDRVLILAPHPDDESLASGGLIQATLAAGGAVRVLVLTDGDNNPWPQRWIEKRWFIGAAGRARWGARRRAEAQQALQHLGVRAQDTRFLGLPDSELTGLLMQDDGPLLATLIDELRAFCPTRLVVPGLRDRHPDHSAAHVLARIAVYRAGNGPIELLSYLVHTGLDALPQTRALSLTVEQVRQKHIAIAAHATQVRLSGRRFLGFATAQEFFMVDTLDRGGPPQSGIVASPPAGADHALWHAGLVSVYLHQPLRRSEEVLLALEGEGASVRLRIPLPLRGGALSLQQTGVATAFVAAAVSLTPTGAILQLQLAPAFAPALIFAKRQRRRRGMMVFDRAGWFEAAIADRV